MRWMVFVVIGILLGGMAFANEVKPELPSANEIMANISQTLHLTHEQIRAIFPIVEQQLLQIKDIQQQFGQLENRKYMLDAIERVKIENRQLISQYLTINQIKIWEAKLAN